MARSAVTEADRVFVLWQSGNRLNNCHNGQILDSLGVISACKCHLGGVTIVGLGTMKRLVPLIGDMGIM